MTPQPEIEQPGVFPFTRGIHPTMYRSRPWTIRQLAGFGTGTDTNARYRTLLEHGATGINGVFDYPSLRAFGSDDARAIPDVGRGGVAVDVVEDFDDLFDAIPLDEVSVSLVSSQPIGAVPHLAMYLAVAEQRAIPWTSLAGTSQNDFLMETAITIAPELLPPAGSFRLECDLIEFATEHLPQWNPVSITGYNYREAGADATLELALCLAHGRAIVDELVRRGHAPQAFLPRVSFFLCAHNDFLEEIAKFRAARRMWATYVRDELGVEDERCQKFRFHTQTSGATNVARFPHVNIARSALQGMAAVLGGTQSLHINGYDEALSIPTEHAALTALRTQYVLLNESGVARSVDPFGGSYVVEELTDDVEAATNAILGDIDRQGGLVAATENGWVHGAISERAFHYQRDIESGERLVVGLNTHMEGEDTPTDAFETPSHTVERQIARLVEVRGRRDAAEFALTMKTLEADCRDGRNCVPATFDAVRAGGTLGEIGNLYRDVMGTWVPPLW
jgi:methylmalonyl-CoA mutase N-terminal domain/subunit